jgi:SAM-dependent methyltransferase
LASLDDPSRIKDLRKTIQAKPALLYFYRETYRKYNDCLKRCPKQGLVVELGTGAGFTKSFIPSIITSDILPYEGIDIVINGTCLPFKSESLRMICMMNVFHHIPDVEAFFREAERCLVPGGRIFITDQNVGVISKPILKFFHHEGFDSECTEWRFKSSGPLSGANGALAWLVFRRDKVKFTQLFPNLRVERVEPHTPILYWFSGGLKNWSLAPALILPMLILLDKLLNLIGNNMGSFLDIEIVKVKL